MKWIKKYLPDKQYIKDHSSPFVRKYFRDSNLWKMNCSSISRGMAVGLFVACVPLPFQMLIAILLSVLVYANIPLAVALTWITNPFTFVPINLFIYWVGHWVVGGPVPDVVNSFFSADFKDLFSKSTYSSEEMREVLKAYFVGLPIVALGSAIIGFFGTLFVCYLIRFFKKR